MSHRILTVMMAALAMVAFASESDAQQRPPARFFIHTVGDTTFAFSVPSDPWVQPGMEGLAVDPARHDSLVARFRVAKVEWGEAIAVITGQTTAVTNSQVALLRMPEPPWYKRKQFWIGLVAGAGLGAGVVVATR